MPVGYGYSADTQPVFIDWAKISKDFTDQVQARKDIAEKEKESILQNRKDFNQTLIDRPSGQNEVANSVLSATATQIKDTSVNNFNRYKNKEITLQQYKNFENNLNSGTDLFFDAVKNYNQNFNEFATRAQNGSASQVEVFMHELMQNYTDFGRIQVNVNPNNGSLIFAQLDKDGNVTDKTLDVSQIGYFSKYKRDKYNIDAAVGNIAQGLGNKFIQDSAGNSLKYQGMMYDELITNETLMKGLDLEVQSLIDQDSEIESVLADSMGYKIVTEKTDNPNELYFNQDANVFEITDGQKQAAFQHVRDKLARAITVERKAAPAEEILTAEEQQYNLIRKYSFIASYGDEVPQDFIDNLLTKKEQESYKTYKENLPQGGGLTDLLSTIGNQINFSSVKEEGKSEVLPFLQEALKPFGMTVEISGGGARLTNGIIQLSYGDSGTVNVEFKDSFGKIKTDQQMINDIITAMQVFKPLKELGYNIMIKDAQPKEPILNN